MRKNSTNTARCKAAANPLDTSSSISAEKTKTSQCKKPSEADQYDLLSRWTALTMAVDHPPRILGLQPDPQVVRPSKPIPPTFETEVVGGGTWSPPKGDNSESLLSPKPAVPRWWVGGCRTRALRSAAWEVQDGSAAPAAADPQSQRCRASAGVEPS